MRLKRLSIPSILLAALFQGGNAMSVNMDSIANKGGFPKFCVNTYRWAGRFFNDVDTAYVQSTGYNMNIKFRSNSWTDFNEFYFDGNRRVCMASPFCTSVGLDVQYLAIALGYDININRLLGGVDRSKSKFNFEFSSALISGRFYSIKNSDGMDITSIGEQKNLHTPFKGMHTSSWGIDVNYFFNHRRYSNSAAFSFGRIQKRSQGAFVVGVAYQHQKLDFDFSLFPDNVKAILPDSWKDRNYKTDGHNFGLSGGYGYNWVPKRNITIGVLGLIIPSLNYGYLNSDSRGYSFRMNYRLNASVIWNYKRWFIGGVGKIDAGFIYSQSSTLTNALFSMELKAGWRFNVF